MRVYKIGSIVYYIQLYRMYRIHTQQACRKRLNRKHDFLNGLGISRNSNDNNNNNKVEKKTNQPTNSGTYTQLRGL